MTLQELKEMAQNCIEGEITYDEINPSIVLQLITRVEKLSEALAQTTILNRYHSDILAEKVLSLYGPEVPLK